jgi:hypothetical protein
VPVNSARIGIHPLRMTKSRLKPNRTPAERCSARLALGKPQFAAERGKNRRQSRAAASS